VLTRLVEIRPQISCDHISPEWRLEILLQIIEGALTIKATVKMLSRDSAVVSSLRFELSVDFDPFFKVVAAFDF